MQLIQSANFEDVLKIRMNQELPNHDFLKISQILYLLHLTPSFIPFANFSLSLSIVILL